MEIIKPHIPGFLDKVAIITGGSRGIGEGCAQVFVSAGGRVVICSRGKSEGEALAAELSTQGPGTCRYMQCDVTHIEQIRLVIEDTAASYGRLDCLINNAGWHPDHRPIDDFSIVEFKELLWLNLVAYFAGCKYALPHLRPTRGSIINMSSLVGSMGQEWATPYVATKGAITAFTKALALDEARHGVRVNAVSPGVISNTMDMARATEVEEVIASWQWAGRKGIPLEVGYACLYLASDRAAFITGIELIISGGAELGYGIKKPDPGVATGLEERA